MGALLTFHERLFADELLPSAVAAALGLEDVSAVYDARRPRRVRSPVEVVLTRLAPVDRGRGGAHQVTEHRYQASVRVRQLTDGAGSGSVQGTTVEQHLAALRAGFDGVRPFIAELEGDVLSSKCDIQEQDVTPADTGAIEGRGLLSFFTRGTGDRDGAAAPGG